MDKKYFTEAAYQYFPRGINEISHLQDYLSSPEFTNLSNKCYQENLKYENGDFKNFYEEIRLLDTSKNFFDSTLFRSNDRAHNLQFGELIGTRHYSICLYISILVPFYTVYVLETDASRFLEEPVDFFQLIDTTPIRNVEMEQVYKSLIDQMAAVSKKHFAIQEFPPELLHTIIPDINYQAIPFGKFTFFNAFFQDSYTYFRL